ncbi:MAG: aspartate kinase [Thermoanaerobaculia bacterium]|nr:aspartate kinase [Thermoanaerobaculia bacterium]
MIVVKFGGTSMGSGERIASVARLVESRAAETPLVVVSAMAGITDCLLALSSAAQKSDRTAADKALSQFAEKHRQAVEALGLSGEDAEACSDEITRETVRLADLSTGVSLLGELSLRTTDAIAASGELLSSLLMTAALRKIGVDAVRIDPREWMATDAQYGCAIPDESRISSLVAMRVMPEVKAGKVVVTGGFVGAAPDGSFTTLGRGGSDYSAALLGGGLHDCGARVDAIEIWTDVDGILTADPRIVTGARLVPEVSYTEAAELAFFGAKVLHPATIKPAVSREILVKVKNTFRPQAPGTSIARTAEGEGVRALAMRKGVAAVFITSPRMLLAYGFAARVFSVLEKLKVSVDVIATSEVSISVTFDEKSPIDDIVSELAQFSDVETMTGLAVVSVVGQNLRSTSGIASRIFTALDAINVVLISQGASETNLTFVVEAENGAEALRRLHKEFFG